MKKLSLIILSSALILGCGRFSNKDEKLGNDVRIVCLAKQYNEIIYALNAQQNLVAVDLSSTYPPAIKELPTVGYHRTLSTEGILSMKPTMIIHDNNVGPEQVMQQMEQLEIPMKVFDNPGSDIPSTKALISEMGQYFHREKEADSLNAKIDREMLVAEDNLQNYAGAEKPRVVIIHYGQASNIYLTMTSASNSAKLIEWAGGEMSIDGDRGMMQLSAEIIAQSNPDVILLTDFGYDRLTGMQEVKDLPGVGATKAAANNRIFRVEEHDMVYFGPRTGEIVLNLQELIHRDGQVQ
jgi:iron complex transport system substrate-binding protein